MNPTVPAKFSEERRFLHDLSNPVSTMTLLLEVLRDCEPGSSEEQECLARLSELLGRVAQLIQARRRRLTE